MDMFRGIFNNTIDGKGRTSMPARFREIFTESFGDERFVITNSIPVNLGNDTYCRGLTVYPYNEWLAIEEKIDQGVGLTPTELNSIKRLIIAPATECVADRQGRVLLPANLRSYAAIERDIVFVGMRKKIEIWDLETWNKVFGQAEKDIPGGTLASAELGL
jgi:MraZ protein